MRSGTLNVPGIVGFGAAALRAIALMPEEAARLTALRDNLWQTLQASIEGIERHGDPVHCLPGNLNVGFSGLDGDGLIAALPELAVSTGSACASATLTPSHVLAALGVSDAMSRHRFASVLAASPPLRRWRKQLP